MRPAGLCLVTLMLTCTVTSCKYLTYIFFADDKYVQINKKAGIACHCAGDW